MSSQPEANSTGDAASGALKELGNRLSQEASSSDDQEREDLLKVCRDITAQSTDTDWLGVWKAVINYHYKQRGRELLITWATDSFEGFLDLCTRGYAHASLRLDITLIFYSVILATPYEPGTPAADTLMYKTAGSPFFLELVRSLQLDTSNTLFPLNLRAVLACIPYAPQVLTPHVPLLMIVLGRAVCWRDRPFVDTESPARDAVTRTPAPDPTLRWEVASASAAPPKVDSANLRPPSIVRLWIVALYGAWPSNVLAFIRDPTPYLEGKAIPCPYNVEWPKVWPNNLLAIRAEPLLMDFGLHPSLILFTSTGELADLKRWEKNDPSAFISRSHMVAHSELQAGGMFSLMAEGPPLPAIPEQSSDAAALVEREEIPEAALTPEQEVVELRKQLEISRLEAEFGNRTRKQMLYHIGRLHKNSLRFNSDEAEIHSFVNRLKEQSKTMASLTAELSTQREEASAAKRKHQSWEAGLRKKNDTFRDERRVWQADETRLRGDLQELQALVKRQKEELAVVKNERFKLQNQLTESAPKLRHIKDYEIQMKQLTDGQKLWDADLEKVHQAEQEVESWRGRCYQLDQLLRATAKQQEEQQLAIECLEALVTYQADARLTPPLSKHDKAPPKERSGFAEFNLIAQSAKTRADNLERENLDLRAEIDRLAKLFEEGAKPVGDREFLWGRSNSPSMFPV